MIESKTYKSMRGLLNNKIFEQEFELVLVAKELQLTVSGDDEVAERFEIATVLLKGEDKKYYKVQLQNDRSNIEKWKNIKQYVIGEAEGLDIRQIGDWEAENIFGDGQLLAHYVYYRPKGKGTHTIKCTREGNTFRLGNYGYIAMEKKHIWLATWGLTEKNIDGEKMKVADLEKMADERNLERRYLNTFIL